MSIEENVRARYSEGAKQRQHALCCPVEYQSELLKMLPQEIVDKDYGCGDPSRYVREGDIVLDLGSGGGKVCYMAAQIVGPAGHVHGVDMTDDMLALARKYQSEMAVKMGHNRVTFHKGHIQNLAFDPQAAAKYVAENPIADAGALAVYESWKAQQQRTAPLIGGDSISLVISNCVLNLVDRADRAQMLREIYRVLKPGGRVAISDIVSDEYVPQDLQDDPQLWSGCISGAFQEEEFLQAFTDAGFMQVAYDKWNEAPWRVVKGIEFRAITLIAAKPMAVEQDVKALMYLGPYKRIEDDFGNCFVRGRRLTVSSTAYQTLLNSDLRDQFVGFDLQAEQTADNGGIAIGQTPAVLATKKTTAENSASAKKCCG